ncbi:MULTISPECIES: chemotaxis protein CheY [Pseudomonas]|uniref:Chemotaxis protein CheY n=1 Tax=Pseudomonas aphyarum TaxID=2942629 RepID=A0ABT5PMI2_9PSED|nr:chemotaxis protein CheY [Pseudomonas aphyarum]MDD0971736.1 chemotaxis protein CheY [Pseudomonas aphyarum]MDD1125113.1 chemotaxis protein CheY [Pseudomonas aphyarum]
MTDKTLRILIADLQHFHRMKIERMFNELDYYRIAPVQSLGELLTLVDYGGQPFDVLVINAELAAGMADLRGFLFDHPQVRRALVYGEATNASGVSRHFGAKIIASPAALPSISAIKQLMTSVEDSPERASRVRSQIHPSRNCQI